MTAPVYLRRIDAGKHMNRYYRLDVQPDLFGQSCFVRAWGCIGKPRPSAPHPLPYPRRGGGGSEKAAHRQRTQGLQVTAPASSRRAFLLIQRMKQAASARFTLYRDKLQAMRTHAIARLRLRRRFLSPEMEQNKEACLNPNTKSFCSKDWAVRNYNHVLSLLAAKNT